MEELGTSPRGRQGPWQRDADRTRGPGIEDSRSEVRDAGAEVEGLDQSPTLGLGVRGALGGGPAGLAALPGL